MFNYRNDGDTELQKALGFLNEANVFKFIEPQIRMQTLSLKVELGGVVTDTLIAHYESDDYDIPGDINAANNYLNLAVNLAQSVIAHRAYRISAPNLDLVHTSTGRKFTQDERMKAAFEHQINRSDDAIQTLEEQALESLILHLNIDPDELTGWIGSPSYLAIRDTFFETWRDFQSVVDINENIRGFKILLPLIKEVQRNYIKAVMGKSQYEQLINRWRQRNETDEDRTLIEVIRPAMAFMAMAMAATRFGAKFFNDGFFSRHDNALKGNKSLSIQERESIANGFQADAQEALHTLQSYLLEIKIASNQDIVIEDPYPVSQPSNKYFRA